MMLARPYVCKTSIRGRLPTFTVHLPLFPWSHSVGILLYTSSRPIGVTASRCVLTTSQSSPATAGPGPGMGIGHDTGSGAYLISATVTSASARGLSRGLSHHITGPSTVQRSSFVRSYVWGRTQSAPHEASIARHPQISRACRATAKSRDVRTILAGRCKISRWFGVDRGGLAGWRITAGRSSESRDKMAAGFNSRRPAAFNP